MGLTVGIIAYAHTGTSMLSAILEMMGVKMVFDDVEDYHHRKWEDHEFIHKLENEDAFAEMVARRNAQVDCWGFKYPGAWQYMDRLERHLRDPVYLAMWKDPVSVTLRRFNSTNRFGRKLRNTIRQMKRAMDGIHAAGQPCHHFSYEDAVLTPARFVDRVADVIGVTLDEPQRERIVSYIQPNVSGNRHRAYPEIEPWISRS